MYIWIGCRLPVDFEAAVRSHCFEINEAIGLSTVAFSLPQHVSLKISFQSERYHEILDDLTAFLKRQPPFSIQIKQVERSNNVLWLPVEDNLLLQQLHEQLDTRLEQCFSIPRHKFDKCFRFHSTLFMDANPDMLSIMHKRLQGFPVAQELSVNTFLLGLSETGKPGQYRVVREIKV